MFFREQYHDAFEELDEQFSKPFGLQIQTTVFDDSIHAHDQKTKRSCIRITVSVDSTLVYL